MVSKEELAERRERWTQALESGKYTQTTGALRDRNGYCCLGVACDLFIKEGLSTQPWQRTDSFYRLDGATGVLPRFVQDWLGLAGVAGVYSVETGTESLAGLNDSGKSFDEIAKIIRSAPEGLFDD